MKKLIIFVAILFVAAACSNDNNNSILPKVTDIRLVVDNPKMEYPVDEEIRFSVTYDGLDPLVNAEVSMLVPYTKITFGVKDAEDQKTIFLREDYNVIDSVCPPLSFAEVGEYTVQLTGYLYENVSILDEKIIKVVNE